MDNQLRAAGTGGSITLAGRTFIVKGRTVGYQAAMEAEIIRVRGNPMDMFVEAAKNLRDDRQLLDTVALAIAERFRNWRMATHGDYAEFMGTPRGQAFNVWYAIKHNEKPPTIQQVEFWLGELSSEFETQDVVDEKGEHSEKMVHVGWKKIQEIISAIDFASGDDALGNSIGPQ
jgi:hypothetical protein